MVKKKSVVTILVVRGGICGITLLIFTKSIDDHVADIIKES